MTKLRKLRPPVSISYGGPGYRKALEFLVKDYVKTFTENAGQKKAIEETPLGACIPKFVTDEKVKSCARKVTTWLGDDRLTTCASGMVRTSVT